MDTLSGRPPRLGDTRLVAVDGRSGSGKSTFAGRLAEAAQEKFTDVALIHTDDLLPGWVHPTGFADNLDNWVLRPLKDREPASYPTYDWVADRFRDTWSDIGRPALLIVEGVTTAAARFRPWLSYAAWVRTDAAECLRRGIERDGEAMRGEWDIWREREVDILAADDIESHADLIVDGAPDIAHDPAAECVVIDAKP
ncbi:MAG TPA: hypothetical protein VE172_02895 [Stackebrandtia sp.]|uniref:uridine kinase family protein n=1 Tax=Stackebrandtia sp. TaxID=2023065 RepID=UPI002D4976A8|nr:hypothetical protein [Stackebrandtia sp.]HZE37735.1 hypothetical protein [Stackebrandtia sp.]